MNKAGEFQSEGIFLEQVHEGKVRNLMLFKSKVNGILTVAVDKDEEVNLMEPYLLSMFVSGNRKILNNGRTIYNNFLIAFDVTPVDQGGEADENEHTQSQDDQGEPSTQG